ncbi:zinc finger and BTB domain-containing protein 41-like [Clavelina lepadiformis]|uniref:zinc finger and BTB domain-containing protein 41-like n=1 Tax=Clavelina lepadiformis TaxID=159417 RepID=UPI0040417FDA
MRKNVEEIFAQRKVDIIHSAFVVHTLYEQQKSGKYCDLKVLVGDKQYFVHRCVLAAASVQLDSQINGLDTIQLVGVTYYGFECLLEILYSGKLQEVHNLSDSKFQQIVSAADALNAETVMEYCTRERGDLMNILLRQSNAAKTSEGKNAETHTSSCKEDLLIKRENINSSGVLDQSVSGDLDRCGNDLLKDNAMRTSKELEQECSEDPVAAEVEVDGFQKSRDDEDNSCRIPSGATRVLEVGTMDDEEDDDDDEDEEGEEEDEYESETGMTCRVCGAVFLSTADLKTHMHIHIGEKLFRCDICGLHFKFQSALVVHKNSHATCRMCGQQFKSSDELQDHLAEEHPSSSENNNRAASSRPNRRKTGVTPSMTRNNKSTDKPAINPIVVNEIMRGENGKYQCPLCDRGFDRRWNLKCHVLIHTSSKKGDCTAGDARYIEAIFTCPECGKLFRNLHNLRRHASSIHGMNATDLAEASESQQGEFNVPRKRQKKETIERDYKYNEDYKFWCTICGRGFKRNRNLRGHMETHQAQGAAKYECPDCGRKFAQKESLNGHLWVHKPTKPEV